MGDGFEISIHDEIDCVDAATWDRLFPTLPDPIELVRLTQVVGIEGFRFGSLLVCDNGKPILLLPLFHLRLNVSTLVDGSLRKVVGVGSKLIPWILQPGVLGVGFVEGECGAVGIDPDLPPQRLEEAWTAVMKRFWEHAKSLGAKVGLFLNFTAETTKFMPAAQFAGFTRIATYPSGALKVGFECEQKYIESLSKNMRKDLRRKLKDAGDVRIEITTNPGVHLDTICALYRQTVARSEMSFGVHRRGYFERICRDVPGAFYTLYFVGDQLLAFNLLVHHGDRLIDKYYGMDLEPGRERNLYFVSWMRNVRYCIEHRIPIYHAGPGSEATKSRLGAELMATLTMFRHRNPITHRLLGKMKSTLAYTPEVSVESVRLG